jgi:hypothetical protein
MISLQLGATSKAQESAEHYEASVISVEQLAKVLEARQLRQLTGLGLPFHCADRDDAVGLVWALVDHDALASAAREM